MYALLSANWSTLCRTKTHEDVPYGYFTNEQQLQVNATFPEDQAGTRYIK